ncbi:beta (1-6) glucans synthase [Pseudomonas citronellolis]|uniref:glycoside hydrolase family 17 protein n=1 Tax=Pseudomonas citronellolis TaxID=53408 RepID=UPI0023E38082|nr:beta (1-6) glucans synthase [Pseudomonas citronellolis]MDF3934240.1 beta (1-6) glucans synthase [Pseudomonas citronellolis]
MTPSPRSAFLPYCLTVLLAFLGLCGLWYGLGAAVSLPDAASPTHKLQCASYSPFGKDQSPFDQPFSLRPAQMDADLALLATRFTCVRTYSMSGLEGIPELARKHGLKLILGAWINAMPADSEREVQKLIAAANAYPDVVQAVIVGNETLLRQEVTSKYLEGLLARVKSQVRQPVSYAEVWEYWLKHPQLATSVDFITLHLLPYWDNQPSGIDGALAHVEEIRLRFDHAFPGKDVLIGETGWPSEGRQRQTALPSRVNEARYLRGFVALAEERGWRYNLIEAFDQPWKRRIEGAVGGYWGLFDADRQEKNVLAGPVSNLPDWPLWLGLSLALWSAALLLGGRPREGRAALLQPLGAALGAACLGLWCAQARVICTFLDEWLWAGYLVLLNLLVLAHLSLALGAAGGWRARLLAQFEARGGWLLLASGFAGAVWMLALVFDARYRNFPNAALLFPALLYLCRPASASGREACLLAVLIAVGIVPQLALEGVDNLQALGWAGVAALLTGALWRGLRRGARSTTTDPVGLAEGT